MRFIIIILIISIFACKSKYDLSSSSLNLSNKELLRIPNDVFYMKNLKYLDLGNSFIIHSPFSVINNEGEVDDYMGLSISSKNRNKIENIPENIGNLTQLRNLGLSYNNLKTLPNTIKNLKNLDSLDISMNRNLTISSELDKLKEMVWLKYLNIQGTKFDTLTIKKLYNYLPNTTIQISFN